MRNLDAPEYKNKHCQACIRKNTDKYGNFEIQCNGITVEKDVRFAMQQGFDEHEARWMYDPRYFFEKVYGSKPRWYQDPILLCTARNLCDRQCRQSGKTLVMVMKIMHFVLTNDKVTVLIVGPNEKVVKKIYDEYIWRDCITRSAELKESVKSKTQKPFYQVEFCNESKIMLMIANETARSQTANWLYIDEAAMVPREMLNSIIMTTGSVGDEAVIIETSTPRGRGNLFFQACKEDPSFNEFHIGISSIEEMKSQIPKFKRLLGETGFIQECEAEFPDVSGGPFSYRGIDLAKQDYEYESCTYNEGIIYIGGVDWNGPTVGSYFYIVGFNPSNYSVQVVDHRVVASANWNSIVAKQTLIELNRKWRCAHWMVDYGYGHTITEELRAYSMQISRSQGMAHPDSRIKSIIDPVEFGSLMTVTDPFTKEEVKKTTKAFIVQSVSRLFEPQNDQVAITFSKHDADLVKSLETYKLLNTTARGFEQYGFLPGDGIEDHQLDSLMLALYGIVKYYSELFKRIIYSSVTLGANQAFVNQVIKPDVIDARGRDILLISSSDDTPIHLEETKIRDPFEQAATIQARTFGRSGAIARSGLSVTSAMRNRSGVITRTRI